MWVVLTVCCACCCRVFGRTFTQVISQLEKSIDAEATLDIAAALPLPSPKEEADGSLPHNDGSDPSGGSLPSASSDASSVEHEAVAGQCEAEVLSANVTVLFDEFQQEAYQLAHGFCRPDEDTTHSREDAVAQASHIVGQAEQTAESPAHQHPSAGSTPDGAISGGSETPRSGGGNGTSTGADGASTHAAKVNATAAATAPLPAAQSAPAPSVSTGASSQGLGRLESIFVRITKKSKRLLLFARPAMSALHGCLFHVTNGLCWLQSKHWSSIRVCSVGRWRTSTRSSALRRALCRSRSCLTLFGLPSADVSTSSNSCYFLTDRPSKTF